MSRPIRCFSLSLLALLALAAPATGASFSYPSFASTAGLTLSAGAVQEGNLLRLTSAEPNKSGRVFRSEAINPQESFATSFALAMHDSTCCLIGGTLKPADGMALVLQNKGPTAGEGTGGSLGYGGIAPSVAVEFDTFTNLGDPPSDHIGIVADGNTTSHLACANYAGPTAPCTGSLPFPLYGAPVYAWVDYDAASQRLKVYAAQTPTKPAAAVLDSPISMAGLGASAYVGFTAATGSHNAVHDVLAWEFNPSSNPPANPPSNSPQPATDPVPPTKPKKKSICPKKGKGTGKKAAASKGKGKGKAKCGRKKGKGEKRGHSAR